MKKIRYGAGILLCTAMVASVSASWNAGGSDSAKITISKRTAPIVMEQSAVGPGINTNGHETNGVSIYVSKKSSTLTLSQNGTVIGTYDATLGTNSSSGNKNVEGDRRTPSGSFYVCLRNDQSIAYLALGLSYPDIPAAERGYRDGLITEAERDAIISANKKGETPPWTTALGGYIEIHGDRNANRPTAGCIAVDNDIMDILWKYCPVGVPVTVGP